MNAQTHPAYAAARLDFAELPVTALLSSVQSERPIIERALALWYAVGADRPSRELQIRPSGGNAVFDWLADTALPHSAVEIARQGFGKGAGMLAAFTVLLSGEVARDASAIRDDEVPPEQMIGESQAGASTCTAEKVGLPCSDSFRAAAGPAPGSAATSHRLDGPSF